MRGGGGGMGLVQITGARLSAMGPEAWMWCICIFRGSINICRKHKLTLSDQA